MGCKEEHVKGNDGRKPKKFMDRVRETMRLKHYSIRKVTTPPSAGSFRAFSPYGPTPSPSCRLYELSEA